MGANNTVSLGPRGRRARPLRGAAKQANARARELELRVWKLLEEGKTPTAIAHEVGIARQSVHRVIRRVEGWYGSQIFATVDRVKRKQVRMLQFVIDEAMVGWARSVNEGTRTILAKRSSAQRGAETSQTRTLTAGDPQFLRVAIEALRDIRELYGIGSSASGSLTEFEGGSTLKIKTVWGTPAESGDATPGPTVPTPSDSTTSPEPDGSAACKGHP